MKHKAKGMEKDKFFFDKCKDYIGTLLFTRKGSAPKEPGALPYNGRRYFQKYVDEAAKEEVKDIFDVSCSPTCATGLPKRRPRRSSVSPSGPPASSKRRVLLRLDAR